MPTRLRTITIDGLDRWHELDFRSSSTVRVADVLTTRPPEVGDEAAIAVDGTRILSGPVRTVLPVRQVWRVRIEPEGSLRRRGADDDRVGPSAWRRVSVADIAAEIWGDQAELVGDAGDAGVERYSLPQDVSHEWAAQAILRHLAGAGISAPTIAVGEDGRWRIGGYDDLVRRGAWSVRPRGLDGLDLTFRAAPFSAFDEIEISSTSSIVAWSVVTLVTEQLYRTEVLQA